MCSSELAAHRLEREKSRARRAAAGRSEPLEAPVDFEMLRRYGRAPPRWKMTTRSTLPTPFPRSAHPEASVITEAQSRSTICAGDASLTADKRQLRRAQALRCFAIAQDPLPADRRRAQPR